MKFGFAEIPSEDYRRHVDLVKRAEELGFDYAWTPDQTFYRDPYVMLALAARETERIGLGIGVVNPYTRHPAMAARAIATLHEAAPGRITLGVGAGNRQELLGPLGFEISHDAARCRETVEIIRALLTGEKVAYEGRHYVARDVELLTAEASGVRLYIGGRGPQILRAAGEVADGVIIGGLSTTAGMRYVWDHVREGAARAERDVSVLDVVCWISCYLTERPAERREAIKPWVAHFIGEAPRDVLEALELPAEVVNRIKEAYAERGSEGAARYVTDECVDSFSLITEPDRGVQRIEILSKAGVTQFCMLLPVGSVDEHRRQLEEFAERVFPRFPDR